MDANTRFLIERIDSARDEVKAEIAKISRKIEHLEGFRQRVLALAVIVSIVGSGATGIILKLLKH